MFIRPYLTSQLERILSDSSNNNVVLLGGARQVGKTTLVLSLIANYPNTIKINLEEDRTLRAQIDQTISFSDFELLLTRELGLRVNEKQILFIDEAQESNLLGSYIRFIKEKWINTKTILTGSSMSRLFREDQRIPVGRIDYHYITPMDFLDFLLAKGETLLADLISGFRGIGTDKSTTVISEISHRAILSQLDLYLKVGGLPEVVKAHIADSDYRKIQSSILYFQAEDFSRKSFLKKESLFMEAMRGVANNLGFSSNYTHVTDNIAEAKNILALMQAWHLVLEIEQHGFNSTSKFHPKRYLYDLGIAQLIRNMPFPDLSSMKTLNPVLRGQLGGLLENLLTISLSQQNLGNPQISSWIQSDQQRTEVDFIWRDKITVPIECKSALKINKRHFSSVQTYLVKTGLRIGIVASLAPFHVFEAGPYRLINVPIYLCRADILQPLIKSYL